MREGQVQVSDNCQGKQYLSCEEKTRSIQADRVGGCPSCIADSYVIETRAQRVGAGVAVHWSVDVGHLEAFSILGHINLYHHTKHNEHFVRLSGWSDYPRAEVGGAVYHQAI